MQKNSHAKTKEMGEPYIHLNTELRSKAEKKFEEIVCKIMKENLSGKFVENVKKKDCKHKSC